MIYIDAEQLQDGLYNIKDGKIYKYKAKGGTARAYKLENRPQGEWIFDIYDSRGVNVCSECGVKIVGYGEDIPFPNCPYCLARMKGADDE